MNQPPGVPPPPPPPSPPNQPGAGAGAGGAGEPVPERRQFFAGGAKEVAKHALTAAEMFTPMSRFFRTVGVDISTPGEQHRNPLGALLAGALRTGAARGDGDGGVAWPGAGQAGGTRKAWPVITLPPGAVPDFYSVCTRCNECVKACPHWAIRYAGPDMGPRLDGFPIITPGDSPCKLCSDLPCIGACEPGALKALPIKDIRLGALAVIDYTACSVPQGKACDVCHKTCPVGDQAIRVDAQGLPQVIDAGCTGCGVCVQECPTGCIRMVAGR